MLGDTGVRRALQNSRIEGLLPPIGMEVFRRLTPASLRWIEQPHEAEEMALEMSERSEEVLHIHISFQLLIPRSQ